MIFYFVLLFIMRCVNSWDICFFRSKSHYYFYVTSGEPMSKSILSLVQLVQAAAKKIMLFVSNILHMTDLVC